MELNLVVVKPDPVAFISFDQELISLNYLRLEGTVRQRNLADENCPREMRRSQQRIEERYPFIRKKLFSRLVEGVPVPVKELAWRRLRCHRAMAIRRCKDEELRALHGVWSGSEANRAIWGASEKLVQAYYKAARRQPPR